MANKAVLSKKTLKGTKSEPRKGSKTKAVSPKARAAGTKGSTGRHTQSRKAERGLRTRAAPPPEREDRPQPGPSAGGFVEAGGVDIEELRRFDPQAAETLERARATADSILKTDLPPPVLLFGGTK